MFTGQVSYEPKEFIQKKFIYKQLYTEDYKPNIIVLQYSRLIVAAKSPRIAVKSKFHYWKWKICIHAHEKIEGTIALRAYIHGV